MLQIWLNEPQPIWRWYGALFTRCCRNRRLRRSEVKNDFGTALAFGSKYKMIQFHKKIHQVLPFKNACGQCRCNCCSPENPKEQQRFGTNPRLSFCIKVLPSEEIYIYIKHIATQNKGRLVKVRVWLWLKQSKQGKDVDASDSRNWMKLVFCHFSDWNLQIVKAGPLVLVLQPRFLWQNKGAEKLRWQSTPGRCRSSVKKAAHFLKFVASLPWEVKLRNIIRHCWIL